MRIAILHDYLNQMGGAENVLHTLHEIFPQAPIYTSFYRPEAMPAAFRELDIRTTFLQKFGPFTPLSPSPEATPALSGGFRAS